MNLFIISGVSHLYHVQNIIKTYNYSNNVLIILKLPHTGETDLNLKNLKKQIINGYFENVSLINLADLKDEYYQLVKEFGLFSHLFMTAFTGIFYDIAKHAKMNKTKLILFEEGLSTYKLDFVKNQSLLEKLTSFLLGQKPPEKDIKNNSKTVVVKEKDNSLRGILRKYFYRLKFLINKVKRKLEYHFFSGYDYAYVTYPEKLSKLMKVSKYENNYTIDFPLNNDVKHTLENIEKKIPENSVLFMSQPMYHTSLTEEEYVELVFECLNKFSERNILIKLHPRETDEKKDIYLTKVEKLDKNIVFIEGENGLQFPSELLLRNNNIKKIVAFSSTTMIYTPLINKEIESISIFNVIDKLNKEKKGAKFIMHEIKRELEKFEHIHFMK